jgi:hypothetical protein
MSDRELIARVIVAASDTYYDGDEPAEQWANTMADAVLASLGDRLLDEAPLRDKLHDSSGRIILTMTIGGWEARLEWYRDHLGTGTGPTIAAAIKDALEAT